MADKESEILVPSQQNIDSELEADKKKKGSQRQDCYAWADPASIFVFELPERAVTHFKIDLRAEGISEKAKVYAPKTKPGKNPKLKIEGGQLTKRGQKIFKAIQLPTGKTEPIKKGGKEIKSVRIRVPSAMSINAIAIWINNQFKQNAPAYFFTERGTKVYIQKDYKDKSKLNNIGIK